MSENLNSNNLENEEFDLTMKIVIFKI